MTTWADIEAITRRVLSEHGVAGIGRAFRLLLPKILDSDSTNLTGQAWAREFDRMRLDPEVRRQILMTVNTGLSQEAAIVPGVAPEDDEASPADVKRAAEIADLVARAFGLNGQASHLVADWMDTPWGKRPVFETFEAACRRQVLYHALGWQAHEVVPYLDPSDGHYYLSLQPRDHASVTEWRTGEGGCGLASMYQGGVMGADAIPRWKLWLTTFDGEGGDPQGFGLARSAYWFWRVKRFFATAMAVVLEKWLAPTLKQRRDFAAAREAGVVTGSDGDAQSEFDQLADAQLAEARKYVSSGGEGVPVDYPFLSLDAFGGSAFDPTPVVSVIRMCDEQIRACWLGQQVGLGQNAVGNQAVGQTHETARLDLVANVMEGLASSLAQPISVLVWLNFGVDTPRHLYPRVEFRGLERNPLAEMLPALPGLSSSGLVGAKARVGNAILGLAGMQPMSEDELEAFESSGRDPLAALRERVASEGVA